MARSYLDFEKPLAEIEAKADDLRAIPDAGRGVADRPELRGGAQQSGGLPQRPEPRG